MDRCPVCDRVKYTEAEWQAFADAGCKPPAGSKCCYRSNDWPGFGRHYYSADDDCRAHAVDWRARYEAERDKVRRAVEVLVEGENWSDCGSGDALAILRGERE